MQITTVKNNFTTEQPEMKTKVVRNPAIARQILKTGGFDVRIVDIKQNRDGDGRSSVFIFLDDDKFQEVFSKVLENNQAARKNNDTSALKDQIADLQKQVETLMAERA